ncbi:MAG: glutathione S-transferase family protein [Gammaproteobacteria bacterium]|nr:glutathione S-transferase family protein [Gammaproteobacteria bacterium]
MKLVIGNKNYSSWSLRPWLLLSAFDIDFEEIQESLIQQGIKQRFGAYSPSRKVPVLIDDDLTVWDSLAICEYVSEKYLNDRGWPDKQQIRAQARAVCCEMHSGFSALRNELPMNCRAQRQITISAQAREDISRIEAIWTENTSSFGEIGPWLFGNFSIADCFYAPVASRFLTYGISLSAPAEKYCQQILNHASVCTWVAAAREETEVIVEDEAGA